MVAGIRFTTPSLRWRSPPWWASSSFTSTSRTIWFKCPRKWSLNTHRVFAFVLFSILRRLRAVLVNMEVFVLITGVHAQGRYQADWFSDALGRAGVEVREYATPLHVFQYRAILLPVPFQCSDGWRKKLFTCNSHAFFFDVLGSGNLPLQGNVWKSDYDGRARARRHQLPGCLFLMNKKHACSW